MSKQGDKRKRRAEKLPREWDQYRSRRRSLPNWAYVGIGLLSGGIIGSGIILAPAPLAEPLRQAASPSVAGTFSLCHTGGGTNCVVDGDTLWVDGVKIRIADIDAPETHPSRCPVEAELGTRATNRLQQLVNAGGFTLEVSGTRGEDRYGRKLRVLMRNGRSLGDMLVEEGLARRWDGARHPWC